MKNKYFYSFLMIVIALPLAWYGFSVSYEFRLLPVALEKDIVLGLNADGRSIEVTVFNDSDYTINSFKLACKSTVYLGNCSMAALLQDSLSEGFSGYKKIYSCRTFINDVHESFVKGYLFPAAVHKEFIETKEAWAADSLSCVVEDPRGYRSYWFEKFIGRISMSVL